MEIQAIPRIDLPLDHHENDYPDAKEKGIQQQLDSGLDQAHFDTGVSAGEGSAGIGAEPTEHL